MGQGSSQTKFVWTDVFGDTHDVLEVNGPYVLYKEGYEYFISDIRGDYWLIAYGALEPAQADLARRIGG